MCEGCCFKSTRLTSLVSNFDRQSCIVYAVCTLGTTSSYLDLSKLASLQATTNKSSKIISGFTLTAVFWLNGKFTCTHMVSSKGVVLVLLFIVQLEPRLVVLPKWWALLLALLSLLVVVVAAVEVVIMAWLLLLFLLVLLLFRVADLLVSFLNGNGNKSILLLDAFELARLELNNWNCWCFNVAVLGTILILAGSRKKKYWKIAFLLNHKYNRLTQLANFLIWSILNYFIYIIFIFVIRVVIKF